MSVNRTRFLIDQLLNTAQGAALVTQDGEGLWVRAHRSCEIGLLPLAAENAARYFPTSATEISTKAIKMVSKPENNILRLINIPTLIRKKGINIDFPINSIRFISGE